MLALQDALREQFTQLKARNPAYSLRAYARRLQVNSGVLSAVMNGQRPVTRRFLEKIVPRMALEPERESAIHADLGLKDLNARARRPGPEVMRLRSDEFRLIADGLHFAVLSLLDLTDCKPSLAWMTSRLGASRSRTGAALKRLERLGLVRREGRCWRSTGRAVRTSEGVSDGAIKLFHAERLREAERCLYEVDVKDRDFLCSTVAIDAARLPLARRLLREFLQKLEAVLGETPRTDVYRIAVQIYPVTRKGSEGK